MRRELRATVVAVVIGLFLVSCSGGGSSDGADGSDGSGASSNGGSSSSGGDGDAAVAAATELLSADPVFADVTYDLTGTVSAAVPASTGGTLAVRVSPTVTATLDVAPGALATDTTIAMTPITSVAIDGGAPTSSDLFAVDLLPSGLMFSGLVTLTFTSDDEWGGADPATLATSGFTVDSDEVVTSDAALVRDGAIVLPLAHFSGHGVGGSGAPSGTTSAYGQFKNAVNKLLNDPASVTPDGGMSDSFYEQLAKLRKDYEKNGLDPAVKAAGATCGAHAVVAEALGYEQMLTLLADPAFTSNGDLISERQAAWEQMFLKEIDCARDECLAGDVTAAAHLAWVIKAIEFGITSSAKLEAMDQDLWKELTNDFRICAQYRVRAAGKVEGTVAFEDAASFQMSESLRLEGVSQPTGPVAMSLTYQQTGWPAGIGTVETAWVNPIWQQIVIPTSEMVTGLADAIGYAIPPEIRPENIPKHLTVECTLPGSIGSTAATEITFQNLGGADGEVLPIFTMTPEPVSDVMTCADVENPGFPYTDDAHYLWDPFYLYPALAALPGMKVVGGALQYEFTENDSAGSHQRQFVAALNGSFSTAMLQGGSTTFLVEVTGVAAERPAFDTPSSPPPATTPVTTPSTPTTPRPSWTDPAAYEMARMLEFFFGPSFHPPDGLPT